MAKNYGRRPSKQKSCAPRHLLGLLVSFVGGYLAAAVFDFTSLTSWINAQISGQQGEKKASVHVAAKKNEMPKPKFEFYTLLAKDHSTPDSITHHAEPVVQTRTTALLPLAIAPTNVPVTVAQPSTVSKESYLLQIASFKNRQDAERMKAELTLKGFDVTIAVASSQQINWFRVVIGPFHSRIEAEKTKVAIARSEHITGMIRKMDA